MRLSHAETQALVSARLDGPLDPVAERELNAHLATCASCRAFNASASNLARGLQSLPYLPASPAVTRAVLDHVSTPRSSWSWLPGAMPANALPAATAIATAVIVVFVGSFAAFQFLDDDEDPSTLPASTLTVTDLAQRTTETAEVTEPEDTFEGQMAVTEEPAPAERNPPTAPAETSDAGAPEDASTEPVETEPTATEIGPPPASDASGASRAQLATDEPATEPAPEPTEEPAPTAEPTPEPPATLSASIRQALGLETAVPTEEPTPEPSPTPEPTVEPTPSPTATARPTLEPTATPTEVPTAIATTEPTAVPTEAPTELPTETPAPTEEPTATAGPTEAPTEELPDLGDDLEIVGPPETPTEEPLVEPTSPSTEEPTAEPIATLEPTVVPSEETTAAPTEEPEPTQEPESTEEQEPTTVPIVQRDETPVDPGEDEGENLDDGSAADDEIMEEDDITADDDDVTGDSSIIDPDEDEQDIASPGSDQTIQQSDDDADGDSNDDGPEQVIEPAGGEDQGMPDDTDDDPADGPEDDSGQGGPGDDMEADDSGVDAGGGSLADADIYASVDEVPGDPGARLGLGADGDLVFSSSPGQVSLERAGISLETASGETGQVVQACANGDCVDISAASATAQGHIDNPIGWLDGEIVYERLNGDQYAVEYRIITLDPGSLQPVRDDLIDGGEDDLERYIRPYAVNGALLVPAPAGWLRITPTSVEIVDGNPFGGDLNLIRVDVAAGRISYVSGGSLILASLGSPGSPDAQIPFSGSDYAVSPDGSRIAVVTGVGIEIWDTSGNVLTTYASDGIQLGSLAWLDQGLVFVDLSNGSLRIMSP